MDKRGVRLQGHVLAPPTEAATIRVRDSEPQGGTGPVMPAEAQISGFNILECADLEEAVEVAAEHPVATFGTLECAHSSTRTAVRRRNSPPRSRRSANLATSPQRQDRRESHGTSLCVPKITRSESPNPAMDLIREPQKWLREHLHGRLRLRRRSVSKRRRAKWVAGRY